MKKIINIKNLTATVLISLISLIINSNITQAAVYKWTDADGNTKFSDIPPTNKEAANIQEINISVKSVNGMDSGTKKDLIEKLDNKSIESEIQEKTADYKKVRDRRADEDVSQFLKRYEPGANPTDQKANQLNPTIQPNQPVTQNQNNINTPSTSQSDQSAQPPENPNSEPSSSLENQDNQFPKTLKELRQIKNCAIAKNNLRKLGLSDLILNKRNKIEKLSESQLKLKIKEAKSQVAYFC
ncbi:MAG: DUF4124 domain-containing protein [Gammaproteobacteria bacterium]|nr:DUF4124 domain-containing protein [Gammaproteobacteria bacterium]